MNKSTKPGSKESVREYMQRQAGTRQPPPSIEEIRRQIGWHLVSHNHRRGR
ncbi:MAG TPA: hypothetical protein VEC06_08975 [Paucimonas sp.]|nr:hypothetical protein [Paucimonas sp.]